MQVNRRRLLLASEDQDRWALRALLQDPLFEAWDIEETDDITRAHFILQMQTCDVILLDSGIYRGREPRDVAWLAAQQQIPVLFVSEPDTELIVSVLHNGARQWLPREVALHQPAILAATLNQLALMGETQRRAKAAAEAVHDCRKQISRLVSLLWDVGPGGDGRPWFPQRHMLERLDEEIARCRRQSSTSTVVLGEVCGVDTSSLAESDQDHGFSWAAQQICQGKRRCDIAGQYGPRGFVMVLPNTTDQGALHFCRRMQVRLERERKDGRSAGSPLQAYFGVVSINAETQSVKSVLKLAEERLDFDKASRAQPTRN